MALDLDPYRLRLVASLAATNAAMADAAEAARTVVLDQSSVGRLTRMDAMQQQAMAKALLARLSTGRRRLEAALARLESGMFGRCCQCGVALEPERLDADPATVLCRDCMEERDQD